MKQFIVLLLACILFSCNEQKNSNTLEKPPVGPVVKKEQFALVIHGGAGTILKKNMTPEKEAAYTTVLENALKIGHTILENGGSSLDAVEQTIHVLENLRT